MTRWFQEGLAQHLEMVDDDVNPIAAYRDKQNLAGFPLTERAGKTTDEAIAAALGLPVSRFNQDLWDWSVNQAPVVWKVPMVRYDEDEDEH